MFLILVLAGIVSSCGSFEPMTPGDDFRNEPSGLAVQATSNATFGIYGETIPLAVKWDVDTKMDIWNGMTVVQQSTYRGEGTYAWKFTGTGSWMGLGIRVNPLTAVKNLGLFSGGYLRFMVRANKRFKVGIKSVGTTTVEKWIAMTNGRYGFYADNVWRTVSIPLSVFTGIDLTKIQQYFMWATDSSLGYTVGSVFYIDKVHYFKTVTYTVPSSSSSVAVSSSSSSSIVSSSSSSSSSSVANSSSSSAAFDPAKALVLYAETIAQNVTWGVDINTNQSPSSPNVLSFDTTTAGEGTRSFKIKVNSNVFNVNWLRYPLVTYLDLSAYANGSLNFMVKAPKDLAVSIHVAENYDIMVQLTNGMYGFKNNNTWCTVKIPMSVYTAKGVDLTRLYGYLKFYGGYYQGITGGEEYFFDKVYFYK